MTCSGAGVNAVEVRDADGVRWITLNRPERLNAFAGDMRDRLAQAIESAADQRDVRVLVITGAGRAFSAGADVEVMEDLLRRDDREAFEALVRAGMRVVRALRAIPQPTVAALNGVAVGAGASLAVACDLRVASSAATVGFTFNRIGLHPDWGATHFLPRLVGRGRAADLIFSGRIVPASEAAALGLVERVVPEAEFSDSVAALAQELAAKAPLAVTLALRSLQPDDALLEGALQRELEAQLRCFSSDDVREGLAAFRERRAPRFTGR